MEKQPNKKPPDGLDPWEVHNAFNLDIPFTDTMREQLSASFPRIAGHENR